MPDIDALRAMLLHAEAFRSRCEEDEYTDTEDAWGVIDMLAGALSRVVDAEEEEQKYRDVHPKRLANLRMKYVSVITKGDLDRWTGPNPDKEPESLKQALDRAALLENRGGAPAYAVVITEIKPGDIKD